MSGLSRRLKHLETSYHIVRRDRATHARNLQSSVRREVLKHLSTDDKRLLLKILTAKQEGTLCSCPLG